MMIDEWISCFNWMLFYFYVRSRTNFVCGIGAKTSHILVSVVVSVAVTVITSFGLQQPVDLHTTNWPMAQSGLIAVNTNWMYYICMNSPFSSNWRQSQEHLIYCSFTIDRGSNNDRFINFILRVNGYDICVWLSGNQFRIGLNAWNLPDYAVWWKRFWTICFKTNFNFIKNV